MPVLKIVPTTVSDGIPDVNVCSALSILDIITTPSSKTEELYGV